jgi:hypothetical protein
MTGPWPGGRGVGGTGNVVDLSRADAAALNATAAIVTGGAVLWTTSDPEMLNWTMRGGLLDGLPSSPAAGVTACGDVHVYRLGPLDDDASPRTWRVVMAGSNGECMNAANASIRPLALVYESNQLQVGGPTVGWAYKGVLYTGSPGDGPRVECPTYFRVAGTNMSVLIHSKTGARGFDTHGTFWSVGVEDEGGALRVVREGRMQIGAGYANEASLTRDGRWITYAWIGGVQGAVDCTNDEGRVLTGCWVGAQSLPREIEVLSDGTLVFRPARELDRLVGTPETAVLHMSSSETLPLPGPGGSQLKVSLSAIARCSPPGGGDGDKFGSDGVAAECAFGIDLLRRVVHVAGGPSNGTWAWTRVWVALPTASADVQSGSVVSSCGAMRESGCAGPVATVSIPPTPPGTPWHADVWLDRSIIETYTTGEQGACVVIEKWTCATIVALQRKPLIVCC